MSKVRQSIIDIGRRRLKRRFGRILQDAFKAIFLIASVFTLASLSVIFYSHVISTDYFGVRETHVRGCKELTDKDILLLAALKPSQNLLALNTTAIGERIRSNPWIKEVYVGRELPRRLVIEVRERKAVALVKTDDGLHLIDEEGALFKKMSKDDEADFIALTGCWRDGRIDDDLLLKSLDLLRYLSSERSLFPAKSIAEVNADEILGFSIFIDNGLCVRLGFDHYGNKLGRLKTVLDDMEKKNIDLKYMLIDLRDPTKISVQRKQIPAPARPAGAAKGFKT